MRLVLFSYLVLLTACSGSKPNSINAISEDKAIVINSPTQIGGTDSKQNEIKKTVSGISYKCNIISAIDYIERKGEIIDAKDLESLKKESVFIMEFSIPDKMKEIFESPRVLMDKDKLIQYLAGQVVDDFEIEQGAKKYNPSGSLYEGIVGNGSTLRVFFFVRGINKDNEMIIRFYDRIFGSGIIKLTKSGSNNLSV